MALNRLIILSTVQLRVTVPQLVTSLDVIYKYYFLIYMYTNTLEASNVQHLLIWLLHCSHLLCLLKTFRLKRISVCFCWTTGDLGIQEGEVWEDE